MKRRSGNRGSAVLMVVGLLTILALLGSAFLVVTYMDRQQSRAASARSGADPSVQGFVSALTAAMADDLYIGTAADANLPYGAVATGAPGWGQVIDANGLDGWLSPDFYKQAGGAAGSVDIDGSGQPCSLYHMGVYNSQGDPYYIAYKVRDAASFVCVNTAGTSDPTYRCQPRTASSVNLQGLMVTVPTAYNNLIKARQVGTTALDCQNYDKAAGRRLLQPDPAFLPACLPFAIGDEMYLRWLTAPAPTEAGRLYQATGMLAPAVRRLLTTYSVTDIRVPRRPQNIAWPFDDFKLRTTPSLANEANQQKTYKRVYALLTKLGVASGDDTLRKKMSACLIANLMPYQERGPGDANGADWHFTPKNAGGTDESFTAYGLTQRLVITEAYAAYKNNDVGGTSPGNYAWCCAVELSNPTGSNIDLNGYADATGAALPSFTVLANGGKVVLYNFGAEGGAWDGNNPPTGDLGLKNTSAANWKKVDSLSLFKDGNFSLVRVYGGGTKVPVDQVFGTDLGYAGIDPVSSNPDAAIHTSDIYRDDDRVERAKYNLAVYKADTTARANKLGNPKGLNDTDMDTLVQCGAPIDRMDAAGQTVLTDIGELSLLYLAGPLKDGTDLRYFPTIIAGKDTVMKDLGGLTQTVTPLTTRSPGRLDPAPKLAGSFPIHGGGYNGGEYPDVPAGCLWSQFFNLIPPDSTRDPNVRVYGRININTAPREVLACLFPPNLQVAGQPVDASVAADYIASYRDRVATKDGKRNYSTRSAAAGSWIGGLRGDTTAVPSTSVNVGGQFFLTPDEVAIPLADYANTLMGWDYSAAEPQWGATKLTRHKDYLKARDSIWRSASNLVSVNTGAAVANVMVALGKPDPIKYPLPPHCKNYWYYVIAIDRSSCGVSIDVPAVTLFSEVK